MNEANFGAILDKPSNEIERPKPLPVGSYHCVIASLPKMDKSTKKGTEYVEFTANILAALEDVDKEALEQVGGIQGKQITTTYYLTEKSAYRLKEFLINDLQIDEMATLRPMLDQTNGRQFIAHIVHTPSQDGQAVFANVGTTAPVE